MHKIKIDPKTGFIWSTKLIKLSWKRAMNYCYDLEFNGYNDWRLPIKDELLTLRNHNIFENVGWFWTCEEYIPDTTYALVMGFYNGYVGHTNKASAYYVRPVRGGFHKLFENSIKKMIENEI